MTKRLLAALAVLSLASARLSAQTVSYVPASEALSGTKAQTFTLSVISPSDLAKNTSAPISLVSFVLGAPSSISPSVAAAGLTISPTTLTFTGPSQSKTVTVTVSPNVTGGTYKWEIEAVGWPVTATNTPMVITLQDFENSLPVVSIAAPTPNDVFYTDGATFNIGVSLGYTATSAVATFPITAVTATLTGPGGTVAVPLTSAGLNTTEAVGDDTAQLTKNGAYTVTFTATNAAGSASVSGNFSLVATPSIGAITDTVAWQGSIASGTTFTGGSVVPVTFLVDSTTTGKPILDKNILVSVYPISSSGYPGVATTYSYATAPKYAVSAADVYTVSWPTTTGAGHYRADIDLTVPYLPPSVGTTTVRLTSLDFYTK